MKISNEEVSRLLAYAPQGRNNDRNTTATTTTTTGLGNIHILPAADVKVSSAARDVQLAKKAISALPDVRADRVSALKAQIENGTYKVSGEDIADLIIRRTLADNTSL